MITISDGVPVPLVIEKKSMLLNLCYPSLANPLGSTKKKGKKYTYSLTLMIFLILEKY